MRPFFIISIFLLVNLCTHAQDYYFPPVTGTEWDTVSPAELGWCTEETDTLLEFLELNNTKAFIVLQNGKIAMEAYFGTFTRDSIWYWASAGKTVTAFLTGSAQEDGYLSISDPTSLYLGNGWTGCLPEDEGLISIYHQLTMTSGLDDGVPDPYCTLDTCLQCLAAAGTRWAYHNAPYTLLESVLEIATDQDFNFYLYDKINSHTGMNGLFIHSGYNNVYYSNARSMARFGLLILNSGRWGNDTLMTDTAYFNAMVTSSQQLNLSYGYLWWLNGKESFMLPGLQYVFPGFLFPDAPQDMFAAMGKNGQLINVVPSRGLVLIRMGNIPEGSSEIAPVFNNYIWQLLNNILCNVEIKDKPNQDIVPQIRIYPNPASNSVNVIIDGRFRNYSIRIYDVMGNLLVSKQDENTISLAGLNSGIYLLEFNSGKDNLRTKFIKK